MVRNKWHSLWKSLTNFLFLISSRIGSRKLVDNFQRQRFIFLTVSYKNCLFLQNPRVEGMAPLAPLLLTVLHPPLSCDHSVIFQRLVPRKEEGLSKKIPPWDATVLLLSSVAYRSERGVIKCPLHFLQEALYNPPSLLYVHSVWVYKKRLYMLVKFW